MEQLKPPGTLNLDGNIAENYKEWLQGFELYLTATGIGAKEGKIQVATFLHVAGIEARRVYNTLDIPDGDKEKIDVLKQKFKDYCEPRKNLTYTRHVFFTRKQGAHETIDSYVTDLKNKAQQCEFAGLTDGLVRDRIVCGIHDEACRARLLRESKLTVKSAIDICRAQEISSQQLKSLKTSEDVNVAVVRRQGKPRVKDIRKKPMSLSTDQPEVKYNCKNCGTTHARKSCPAFGKECHACKKKNHFATCCLSKRNIPKKKVHSVHSVVPSSSEDEPEDDELFIGTVTKVHIDLCDVNTEGEDWTETLTINNFKVKFKLDTGAQANILPKKVFDKLNIDDSSIRQTRTRLVMHDGTKILPLGTIELDCEFHGTVYNIRFFVVSSNAQPILSKDACCMIGSIIRVHAVDSYKELTNEEILSDLNDVFQGLGKLPGTHHIELDMTVPPVVHPPRKVPAALRDEVRVELDRMLKLGVIAKQDGPTDWVHSMVIVRKPGKLRVCIDPKDLNRAVKREHYHLETIEEVVERLPKAKVFSKFDATHGFWQLELDDSSSRLLTFNTPFGRYRYLRLAFGISSAPEVFSKRVREMSADLPGVECIVDDILVWGENNEQHDARVRSMLHRCREMNFKLNKAKYELRVPEVSYVGHIISKDGLKVNPEKVRAIQEMPTPTDVQGVKRFLGMVQYLGKFIPHLSDVSAPLRSLLQSDVSWHWDKQQQESFEQLKQLVSTAPVLRFFDVTEPVTINVDASSKGLGVVLLQAGQPVAYGSRTLTETQSRYAQIEREMLAILYGCEKFHHYIYARSAVVETDHKPLVAIFEKPLYRATPRLQRMLLKLQRYDLKLVHVPGKQMFISDTLSRACLVNSSDELLDDELDVSSLEAELPASPAKLQELKDATSTDSSLHALMSIVMSGWPSHRDLVPEICRGYWNYRDEITAIDGLLYKSQRLIIPKGLRPEMLRKLHESHLGIVKTKQRAREILFWPNMNSDIEVLISSCSVCNKFRNSNCKQPLNCHAIPSRPWAKLAADLFEFKGNEYLVCVDYYSKYPEVVLLQKTTSSATITALKSIFARHGVPSEIVTDNGPQFSSAKFKEFAETWDFIHTTSSPRYPKSNGQAERFVQTVKNLLYKADESNGDIYVCLMEYRASPIDGLGLSPSQLLMNRQLKTKLPVARNLVKPEVSVSRALTTRQDRYKFYHDRQIVSLLKVHPGEIVRIQKDEKQWEPAIVEGEHSNRSYVVQTGNGHKLRRNRQHILKTNEQTLPKPTEFPIESEFPSMSQSNVNDATLRDATCPNVVREPPIATPTSAVVKSSPTIKKTSSGRVVKVPKSLDDYVTYN